MLNGNDHKNFTACNDAEAEALLQRVLLETGETLSGTGLCVLLGGSYGRGDGGVRLDRNNGILYNDLDFFVFARKESDNAAAILKEVAEKYENELKIDVDFSRIMTIKDIKNNASRLMMQELKRGYHLVCGTDLIAEYLPEIPANALPFSEACRLLLNRGMGLLFAGEKIAANSADSDFILRNIYKAILGAGDAMLIAKGEYRWRISERLEVIGKSGLPEQWKEFYREAVNFKHSPHSEKKPDMNVFWHDVRDFFQYAMVQCAEVSEVCDLPEGIYRCCRKRGETSIKNYIKYCIKTRSLPLKGFKNHTIPAVAAVMCEVYSALNTMSEKTDEKLYRLWQIFN